MINLKKELNNLGLNFKESNKEYIDFIEKMGDINNQEYKENVKCILVRLGDKSFLEPLGNGDYGYLYDLLKKYR